MIDESFVQNGLHDLRNQLLELQLSWDLIVEKEKLTNTKFSVMIEKVKGTAEFLQDLCKIKKSIEHVEIRNLLHLALQQLHDKGVSFSCMISDSFPVIVTNRGLLLLTMQAVFIQALKRFHKGLLVRKEKHDDKLIILLEPGNEPVTDINPITCDIGAATIQSLMRLLNGRVEWNGHTQSGGIQVVLPLEIAASNKDGLRKEAETCQ